MEWSTLSRLSRRQRSYPRHAKTNTPCHRFMLLALAILMFSSPLWISLSLPLEARAASFPDVASTDPAAQAIDELAARGIVRGYSDGTFGPNDPVLRGQAAGFVTRAMGWSLEDHGNIFSDPGPIDGTLWRNVGTLAFYKVAKGYPDGTYQPTQQVLNTQVISLITRAMVTRGLWVQQADDPNVYPNIPATTGHRADIVTFARYVGPLPGTTTTTQNHPTWDQPDTRSDFALALWDALQTALSQFPAPSPSGEAMPVGDLPGWHQVFADDFTTNVPLGSFPGSAYNARWSMYPDGARDTAGQQGSPSRYYPSKVVSVNNGVLDKYLHTENGTPMGAALLPLTPSPQTYGRYAVRFRADSLAGFKTAWLLWPDSGVWPQAGEIDFPEGDLDGTMFAFMHRLGATSGSDQDWYNTNTSYTGWHTTVIEWTPERVTFILDGRVVGTSTNRIPNTPMHYVLQTESCLNGCPDANTAGHLQIDWVTIYTLAK